MLTAEGAFASSLDADSEGEEGRFYVWNLAEIREVLGDDAEFFARVYDVSEGGNWEHANILNQLESGAVDAATEARLAPMRARLLERRGQRVRPGLDDKVLADWNGLMIAALVRAALALDQSVWIGLAQRAFRFVADSMSKDGLLPAWVSKVHPKFQTPWIITIVTGLLVAVPAGFLKVREAGALVSIGTLLAFVIVAVGVMILRVREPNLQRPFKTPMIWVVAPLSALSALYLMWYLPWITWERLLIWLAIGLVIYFGYGRTRSKIHATGSQRGV
jgi:hypothetical protein